MNCQSLYECILNAYVTLGIDAFPIDCFELVRHCGFKIVKYSDMSQKKRVACQLLSNDACLLDGTLFYEAKAHPRRIQFTIAHEFAHVFLKTDDEDEADNFASHFLAPRILIHKHGYRNAEQLHNAFGLSYAASNRALISYNEWFRNIAYSKIRKPTEPEIQLEHILFPELVPITEDITHLVGNTEDKQLNERSDFMKFLNKWRGDSGFGIAESQWIYGNDL